jgi:SAM-dependent methyltransferase
MITESATKEPGGPVIRQKSNASIDFSIQWKSAHATHKDCYYARKVNFWRDIFPREVYELLIGTNEGDMVELPQKTGMIVPPYDPGYMCDIDIGQFDRTSSEEPCDGRFYPKGLLRSMPGIFRGNKEPFRCIRRSRDTISADFNHPLSPYPLKLKAGIHEIRDKAQELGGSCTDWMAVIAEGPGMQARWNEVPTDFFTYGAFHRKDDRTDALFYEKPRLVTHIDRKAISLITGIYKMLLRGRANVLDLMSSYKSHLPDDITFNSVAGLGMNGQELLLNDRLTSRVIHDLNKNPELPFRNEEFDAVICTVSVEYLTKPFKVFEDVARVLKQGGIFIVTFSQRWFPPKAIEIWEKIHEFERMGLVLEYFMRSGMFHDLNTYSMRGLTRPEDDRYYPDFLVSDPVFGVWGIKK